MQQENTDTGWNGLILLCYTLMLHGYSYTHPSTLVCDGVTLLCYITCLYRPLQFYNSWLLFSNSIKSWSVINSYITEPPMIYTHVNVTMSPTFKETLASCDRKTIAKAIYWADPFRLIVPIGSTNCVTFEFIFKSSSTLNIEGREAALKSIL